MGRKMVHDGPSAVIRLVLALPPLSTAGIMLGCGQTPITFFQGEIFHSFGLQFAALCKIRRYRTCALNSPRS
jgi:hypothetical protein